MTGYRLGVHDSNVALPHLSSSDDVVQPHECYLIRHCRTSVPCSGIAILLVHLFIGQANSAHLTCYWSWHFINMQYTNPNENHAL